MIDEGFPVYKVYAWGALSKNIALKEMGEYYIVKAEPTGKRGNPGLRRVLKHDKETKARYYKNFKEAKLEALRRHCAKLRSLVDGVILFERLVEELAMAEEENVTFVGVLPEEGEDV